LDVKQAIVIVDVAKGPDMARVNRAQVLAKVTYLINNQNIKVYY
jgi:hypothetical protein